MAVYSRIQSALELLKERFKDEASGSVSKAACSNRASLVLSALIRFLISSWNWHTRLRLKGLRPKRRSRAIRLVADQKTRLFFKHPTTDGVNRKEDNSY
jgi:hypothetical protein